jgi:hypothetical protein
MLRVRDIVKAGAYLKIIMPKNSLVNGQWRSLINSTGRL